MRVVDNKTNNMYSSSITGNDLYDGNSFEKSAVYNYYLWQGREYSRTTHLYYFRARWYDPITGRWLSKDPIGISGGLNQYVFCCDNGINFVDPFGLCEKVGYRGGWWNPLNWRRGLYTGDPRATDNIYGDAILEASETLGIIGSPEWKRRTNERRLPGANVISPWSLAESAAVETVVRGSEAYLRWSATARFTSTRLTSSSIYVSGYKVSRFKAAGVVRGAGQVWAVIGAFYGCYDIGCGILTYWEMAGE